MGGSREGFPETVWSSIVAGKTRDREAARETLLARYWRPVYRFIRTAGGRTVEDAKDLTQEFFRHVLEEDVLAKYSPDRGRLRHYIKGTLRNFLIELDRAGRAQKRGGGRAPLPLDVAGLEAVASETATPDELFDRQWRADVLAHSLETLRETLTREGKADYLRAYELYELDAERRRTYDDVAREMGIPTTQVHNFLHAVRARLQRIVIETVTESVDTPDHLADEVNELFGW